MLKINSLVLDRDVTFVAWRFVLFRLVFLSLSNSGLWLLNIFFVLGIVLTFLKCYNADV